MSKRILYLSIIAFAAILLVSCDKHDPSYDNVTRPVVKAANSTLSGIVTDYPGNVIANAVININGIEVRTDANGFYTYDLTQAGTYEISASYTDKITQNATVQVASVEVTHHYIQNFRLPGYAAVIIHSGETNKDTETIDGNEVHGTITITTSVVIEESALPVGASLLLVPIYSQTDGENVVKTKGGNTHTEYRVLAGSVLKCTAPDFTTLESPGRMIMNVVKEVQGLVDLKKFNRTTGKWEKIQYTSFDDRIEFDVTDLTAYAIFGYVNISVENFSTPITDFMPQDFWDNYNGSNTIHVDAVSYTRQVGLNLDEKQGVDQLRALLLEKLAQDYGLGKEKTVEETYTLNVDLPVGTALSISGSQESLHVIYEMGGKSVNADINGNTVVTPKTYNRVHTGGGNYVTY